MSEQQQFPLLSFVERTTTAATTAGTTTTTTTTVMMMADEDGSDGDALFHVFEYLTVARIIERYNIEPFEIILNQWTVMPLPEATVLSSLGVDPTTTTTSVADQLPYTDDDDAINNNNTIK